MLVTPKPWVIGVLINNQWSVGGDPNRPAVNAFLAQPFANYNMAGGWFLNTSPIITANWNAPSGQKWTVPIGGGVGRVFKIDDQAYNASIQGYYNVVRPDHAADLELADFARPAIPEIARRPSISTVCTSRNRAASSAHLTHSILPERHVHCWIVTL